MPTYTYQCQKCEHVFDEFHSMSNMHVPEENPCPQCHEADCVKKIIASAAPIVDPYTVGRLRLNNDFRNKLENIKKFYKNPRINEYGIDR